MKKGRLTLSLSIACFLTYPNLKAEQLITLFLRPYPSLNQKDKARKIVQKVANPSQLARQNLKRVLSAKHIISGIFATYAGFLTVSDLNGQIRFPRKHPAPRITLVITERITPIVRSGNTLSHWELNTDYPAAVYQISRVHIEKTKTDFFDIQKVALPENNIIPLESIVLFAKPKFIYAPLGLTETKESPHLILPDIYVKRNISLTSEALYVLNVMHYFGLLTLLTKKELKRYSTALVY